MWAWVHRLGSLSPLVGAGKYRAALARAITAESRISDAEEVAMQFSEKAGHWRTIAKCLARRKGSRVFIKNVEIEKSVRWKIAVNDAPKHAARPPGLMVEVYPDPDQRPPV